MTSTAQTGERRWGSARRSGMTVLGKVAVPKPLNLPSQRLENHGLDPNVEIVPKGTLGWGNHSSSSATNAWGSSSADSKAYSPGRPSSGGSGTRPSTAGSDRVNETSGSAWGPNSRPSSASGISSSNQSSLTSLRPHSAEPRPASSQLSRFAEPVSDGQGEIIASGTSERSGMVSAKKEDFSLSSGDFPTLGSEKDQSSNFSELKDPASRTIRNAVSGEEAPVKDEMDLAFDRLKIHGSESLGDGPHPSMEKWQAEHQQYFNPNIPPQHFDAWRGPPMNPPSGVWYRGGPQGGPPFGSPVGPGGFPIEPFPYYPPQIPPPAFANSQPVPPPRGGPRGHHPKSGNPYRPQMHDSFVHPGMSYRPGFYPPPMAFESYHGPPRGYRNPNEPDIPFMNLGTNRPVYDGRYSAPNAPGPNDSYARAGRPGPAGKSNSEVDFFHSGDSQIPVKFLSRQQAEWDGKGQAENREHMPPYLASNPVKAEKNVVKPRKYEWGAEDDGDDDINPSAHFSGGGNYEKPTDEYRIKKLVSMSTSPLVSAPKELEHAYRPTAKGLTLMRKREDLNAKVRSDGSADCFSSGEEQKCGLDAAIDKVDTFPRKSGYAPPIQRSSISEVVFSHDVVGPGDDRVVHHTAAPMLRRPYHAMSNKSDHGGKGKFGNQPADGLQMRPLASKVESDRNFVECGFQQDMEVAEIHQPSKVEGGFNTKLQDSTGSQAQRAKMREITKQRAMQLQREEEERIRDQKAKALAKLEELNRRTQSGDASNPVAKKSVSSKTSKEQQEGDDVELTESVIKVDSPSLVIQLKSEGGLVNDENKKVVLGSSITSKIVPVEPLKVNESAETVPLKHVVNAGIRDGASSHELDGRWNKSTSYKQKQNNAAVKNYNEKSVSVDSREGRKSPTDTTVKDREPDFTSSDVCSSKKPSVDIRNDISQSSVEHRRSSRSSKSKNKHDDAARVSTTVATGPTQTVPSETSHKIVMPQAPSLQLSFGSIQVAVNGESGLEMPDQSSSLLNEDTHKEVNSRLKPQHTSRMPRVQQVNNKLSVDDAAVWAPVRSPNKVGTSEEDTAKGDLKQGPKSGTSGKSANLAQNSSRSKRAEMERYIPKPVAKELAEQVGTQPIVSSVCTSTLDDLPSVQHVGSETTVYAGSSVESGQGLMKHNKPGKTHGAWRQRGSTEFSHAKNIRKIPSDSDPSKSYLEDVSLNQSNPESDQLQAVTKTTSGMIDSGSSLCSDVRAPETHHVPKDTVVTGKGRHYSYRGHKKSDNFQNNDDRNISSAESDISYAQTPFPDTNQTDRAITPKEDRASSERASSHWQPKVYAHSVSGQKVSRITGSQGGGGEASTDNRKDYPLQQQGRTSQHIESNDIDVSHSQRVPESKAEGNHEPRSGRKLISSKSSNYNTIDEIGHHHRPRHMHYEYQPVGSLDYKNNNLEGQGDGIRNAGSRNRGRGHSHQRRGSGNSRFPRSEHHQLATE
ncbi:hypothetical protein LIER_00533 [Lithospermum erythrorhizon]|uniref:BAT2 N-terminal domain-containing protein n=1 Tax=Lithospermum erythrorhizon TaxID=34254 RepID=A0AAV3NM71_LITER